MSDIDRVAEVMFTNTHGFPAWTELNEDDRGLYRALAEAAIEAVHPPERVFTDDLGRRWEWCGGVQGTWAWRVTAAEEQLP